ncbi:replication initiator, partial [Streptomyces sp. NPDC059744]|uniref:replication initiator n=1 Tax=Streptomyces sp. NPDC059744 TaxID=3346929 RepID=UPI00365FA554
SHMLGFRGHFSTKTPRYSTTLGALRGARADWRAQQERQERGLEPLDQNDDTTEDTTLVIAHWEYAGQGHTPGESWLAASIANEIRQNRELARENRTELEGDGWDE